MNEPVLYSHTNFIVLAVTGSDCCVVLHGIFILILQGILKALVVFLLYTIHLQQVSNCNKLKCSSLCVISVTS